MSELLGEARVLIRPDTTAFRAELEAQVLAATRGIVVPVQIAASTAASQSALALTGAQETAAASTLGLAKAAEVENTAFGKQAVVLGSVSAGTLELAGAQASLAAASKASSANLLGLGSASGKLDAALLGLRTAVGSTAVIGLGAGALAAIAFGKAIRSSIASTAAVEEQMNVFAVTAGATASEMQAVSLAAQKLGADVKLPGVSAADAAQAMTELAKAGLDVQDSIAGAEGVLQLATAAAIDNASAVQIAASALNAFGLSGDEATRVADVLAGAANQAQGSIVDMGTSLQQAAAVGRQVGLSLETTVTMLTLLARNGLRGSDAGTSLRTALIRLINPTAEARKQIQELGISIRDATGAVRPDVFAQFQRATEELTPAARDAALALIFGQDALRAASILAREGAAGFDETAAAVTRSGQAAEQSAARSKGLAGAWRNLSSQGETLGLTIGNVLNPYLESLVEGAARGIGVINAFAAAVQKLGGSAKEPADSFGGLVQEVAKLAALAQKPGGQGSFVQPELDALVKKLREEMNPALLETTSSTKGYTVSLSDAATRSIETARSSAFLASGLSDAGTRASAATTGIDQFTGALKRLNDEQIRGQLQSQRTAVARARAFGGDEELLASLEAERARIDRILASDRAPKGAALERLLQDRAAVQNEIDSILQRQAADRKSAAQDLEQKTREADDALLAALSQGRDVAQNRIARAETTKTLRDDIAAQKAYSALIVDQIAEIKREVQDQQAKKAAVIALTSTLIATNATIKQLEAQRKDRKDQIQELNIQIAEERGNQAALRRAINIRIKTLDDQIRAAKGDQVRVKQLILERERLRNQLKDLNKADQQARNGFKTFVFEQLQAQQGFAANLLGNIIRGPTTGLVGVPAPTGPAPPSVDDAIRVGQGTAAARQGGSPTAGQSNAIIAVLNQILNVLKQGNLNSSAPEAIYNKKDGRSIMDGVGGGGTNAVM